MGRILRIAIGLVLLLGALPAVASAAECTNTWTGGAEGTWQTATNWSAGNVPTSTDVACIPVGKTVKVSAGTHSVAVVQGEGTLFLREATLEVLNTTEASEVGSLKVGYKSVLTGPATVVASSNFEWLSESTMSGTGATVVGPEATGSITTGGGWGNLKERHLVNEGTFAINVGILAPAEGAVFENKGTLTINHEEGVWDVVDNGGTVRPKMVNRGVLQKTAGTGETHFDINFDNYGEINAKTGTLGFTLKGSTGTWGDGSTFKGAILIQGPNYTTESFDAEELTISGASLSMAGGDTGAVEKLLLGGTIKGAGSIEISKSLLWDGYMSGTGSTVIGPTATATVNTYWSGLSQRTVVNKGTFTLEQQGLITATEGAVFENYGTLYANAVEAYARYPGIRTMEGPATALLVNHGTIEKTVGTGNTRFDVNVANYGTIAARTGTLLYNQNGALAVFAPGSVLEGTNMFWRTGISGKNFSVPDGMLSVHESPFMIEGEDTEVDQMRIEYGTVMAGPGDIKVKDAFFWEGSSTLGGSGEIVLAPTATGTLDSGATTVTVSQRKFVNEGTFNQKSSSKLNLAGGATFLNEGTYNLNSEPYPTWVRDSIHFEKGPLSSRFVNRGLFQRTEGKLDLEVTAEFQNLGVIKNQSSKVIFKNPVTVAQTERFGMRCHCGDPIESATGDFFESQTDIDIDGRGTGLFLTRSYSAKAAATASAAGRFGYGWTSSFSDRLVVEGGGEKVTLTRGDGSTVPFTRVFGAYVSPNWSQDELSGNPETSYTLTGVDQMEMHFSGAGRLESVVDRNGNATTLAYDEAGRLKTVTDPAGRQLVFAYNVGGQVESVEDPMGHLVKYGYEAGNLTSVTMPGEATPRWQFKYDSSHRITSATDGRGGKTTNEYDSSNRVISQTDPAGTTLTLEYEPFHTTITNKATGAVTDLWLTSNNSPFSVTRGYGTPEATTETFAYNEDGRLTRITDGNGHTTTYGYDADGNRSSEKEAAGEIKWTYDESRDVISTTSPGGETTTIGRDSNGNIESISRPGPGETTQTTTFDRDEYGQLTGVTDPLERTWVFGYDSFGNRTSETNPLGQTQTNGYDENSRLVSVVSPRGNAEGAQPSDYETVIERDAQGRPLKVTDPLGHATKYAYDGNGNLISVTDAKNHTTKYAYDAMGQRTKVERSNGAILKTEYNGEGYVTSQADGNGETTTYVRNVLGQPVEVIDSLGRKTIKEFDDAGNLVKMIDPAERETIYSYDSADHLTEIDYSSETTADVSFEYDPDGNLVAMVDGTGESSFDYDELGRLTRSEDGHGNVVEYEHDLAGQLTDIVYPNGKSVSRSYDAAARLESVTD